MNPIQHLFLHLSIACLTLQSIQAFTLPIHHPVKIPTRTHLHSSAPSDVDDSEPLELSRESSLIPSPEAMMLKQNLLTLCASYDRGFGASPRAKEQVDAILNELESMNPTPINAAQGIDGNGNDAPLAGAWRMVWTTALDVLNLGGSPVAAPGAIYQVIEPPIATNIIDFIPRVQSFLPSTFPSTLLRAKVQTRAAPRANNSNRVGLVFEAVSLNPVQVLGVDATQFPSLAVPLPTIDLEKLPGVDPETAPGFFDVSYLDQDMLVIQQNAPGGYFVSVKVDNYDP